MSELRRSTAAARRLWALQTFLLLLLAWLALDGSGALLPGIALAAVATLTGLWFAPGEPYPWRPHRLLGYLAHFLLESVRGGIDIAWRVLHPRLPIDPHYLEHRTALPPGLPRSMFVSAVNLLPGTLCVGMDDDGLLTVHALTPRAAGDLPQVEREVARLFGLDETAPAPWLERQASASAGSEERRS